MLDLTSAELDGHERTVLTSKMGFNLSFAHPGDIQPFCYADVIRRLMHGTWGLPMIEFILWS
jgi:hypothetical protein